MNTVSHNHFLKANWATKTLETLGRAVIEWFKDNSHFTHRVEPDPDNPSQSVLKVTADEIPIAPLSLVIGDIVQNIRSSLDHVAYALAAAHTKPLPEDCARASQFPIFGDEDGKGISGQGPTMFQKDTLRTLKCVDPQVKQFIESVQPYHLGAKFREHSLWQLQYLSNVDKHRILHVAAAYAASYKVSGCFVSGVFDNRPGIVKGETVVARLGSLTPMNPDQTVEMQVVPKMTVAFAEGELRNRFVIDTLDTIIKYVGKEVLTPLTRDFL